MSRYRYKGGGLVIRSTDIETRTPSTDIEAASVSVLLGLDIGTKSRYPYKGKGLGIGNVRIKFVPKVNHKGGVSVTVLVRIPRPQCTLCGLNYVFLFS